MSETNRKWYSGMTTSEDWWAVWLGLALFLAGLTSIVGLDMVGWMAKTKTWVWGEFSWANVLAPAGKGWKSIGPLGSLFMTYAVFTVLTMIGAFFMKLDLKKFFMGWTVIFFITWACWIIGHEAHFKALKTSQSQNQPEIYGPDVYCTSKVTKCTKEINKALLAMGVDVKKGDVPDMQTAAKAVDEAKHAKRLKGGLQFGGGFSFMLALAVGLIIGNIFKGFAAFLKEAAKPEWFIKTAIVYLGIKIGLMSMKAAGFTFELAFAGMCATIVAYMFFWPITYWIGRRFFNLPRAASAVLSSGVSICGVSAAIATAGAIRARAVLPVMVSMLIVVFAMFELIILPGIYTYIAPNQPIVNPMHPFMTVVVGTLVILITGSALSRRGG